MAETTIGQDAQIATNSYPSILCDGQILNNIITEFGVQVVVREVNRSFNSEEAYDIPDENTADHRTTAFVNTYSETDDEVQEGVFKSGTITLSFQNSDASFIKPGNRVWFDGKWFEITTLNQNYSASTKFLIQAVINRIE